MPYYSEGRRPHALVSSFNIASPSIAQYVQDTSSVSSCAHLTNRHLMLPIQYIFALCLWVDHTHVSTSQTIALMLSVRRYVCEICVTYCEFISSTEHTANERGTPSMYDLRSTRNCVRNLNKHARTPIEKRTCLEVASLKNLG